MSVELLQTLSVVAYIIAAVLLVLTVALFFLLDIKEVFGDLSGATARKAIADIRRQTGGENAVYYVNRKQKKGQANGKKQDGHKAGKSQTQRLVVKPQVTEILDADMTAALGDGNVTAVLDAETAPLDGETASLSETDVTGVLSETGVTGVLGESGVTGVLNQDPSAPDKKEDFSVDVEMGFTSSQEIIE